MVEHVADEDRPRVVVTCIIWRLEHSVPVYLIKKRNERPPYAGRWEIVGEGFEIAKDFDDGMEAEGQPGVIERVVRRGIEEEVGLQVGRLLYIGSFGFVRSHDAVPVVGLRFHARHKSGIVRLNNESTHFLWITVAELDDYSLIGSIADDIRKLDAKLKKTRRKRS